MLSLANLSVFLLVNICEIFLFDKITPCKKGMRIIWMQVKCLFYSLITHGYVFDYKVLNEIRYGIWVTWYWQSGGYYFRSTLIICFKQFFSFSAYKPWSPLGAFRIIIAFNHISVPLDIEKLEILLFRHVISQGPV